MAQILPFPHARDTAVEVARIELRAAWYRLESVSEALDARNPENWGCFHFARESVLEAEERLRGLL